MTSEPLASRASSPAEDLFADYILSRSAREPDDFDALCAAHTECAAELRALHVRHFGAKEVQRALDLGSLPSRGPATARRNAEIFEDLHARGAQVARYRVIEKIGAGGMGTVYEAEDQLLGRTVALKVISSAGRVGDLLPLFHREMRIAARIGHPGVAGIHDAGVDAQGRAFFTMPLVRGRDLSTILRLVREKQDGWDLPRALGVLRQVSETMAYVHSRGIIHRDLKPENIRVGDFGEVFVMDWGLAKELDSADPAPVPLSASNAVGSEPGHARGTPPYLSPEQALGDETLGPATDVYAIGVMLYELLAGRAPYLRPGDAVDPHRLALLIAQGPPDPLERAAPDAPLELAAICHTAMARRPTDRFSDAQALAADLQAYLDGRVPTAFPVGPWGQARKWVLRNRLPAALLASAIVLLSLVSISTLAWSTLRERRARELVDLDSFQELTRLQRDQESLWPIRTQDQPRYVNWLERADSLLSGKPGLAGHEARLREIESRATRLPLAEGEGSRLVFEDPEDTLWHGILARFLSDLAGFTDPQNGLVASTAASVEHGLSVGRRLEICTRILAPLAQDPGVRESWQRVRADLAVDPRFQGFLLEASEDLLPLRRDPASGLWEFAVLTTGSPPVVAAQGGYELRSETAVVLVLLPGGTFEMGAQSENPDARGYDRRANKLESPPHTLSLAPFFLSKYELTQGQWHALTHADPSTYGPRALGAELEEGRRHPVESVDWFECRRVLGHVQLELPTEAQWEYAARAGTPTAWWTGAEEDSLEGAANVADQFAAQEGPRNWVYARFDDGHFVHAAVGSFRPNGFGLHDTAGNVMEWCEDLEALYDQAPRPGDGLRQGAVDARKRCFRGGAWDGDPAYSRSACRGFDLPGSRFQALGVRPARAAAHGDR